MPRPHTSALGSDMAIWDAAVREGVCLALDALHDAGYIEAYDAMMLRLFGLVRTSGGFVPIEPGGRA